jgi:hypothetical protein
LTDNIIGTALPYTTYFRHKKTHGVYVILGKTILQTDTPLYDKAELVTYLKVHPPMVSGSSALTAARDVPRIFARPTEEFFDSARFEPVAVETNKLDAKFFGKIFKYKDLSVVPDDQWVVFLAKDQVFVDMFLDPDHGYLARCKNANADPQQIAAVQRMEKRLTTWVATNETKTPDAKGERLLDLDADIANQNLKNIE